MSGIKPHTIRIWEQRYDLVNPERTDANFRCYNTRDVVYLIRLAGLNHDGHKISSLAEKTREEITSDFDELKMRATNPEFFVQCLLINMLNLDQVSFMANLALSQSKIGIDETCTEVCFKLIEKCNQVLTKRKINSCYEHFAHALIRNHFLSNQIELKNSDLNRNGKTYVLFILESDFHECELLYASYKLRKAGHQVIYLGFKINADHINEIARDIPVDYFLTTINTFSSKKKIENNIKKILAELDDKSTLIIHSKNADKLVPQESKAKCISLTDLAEFKSFLNNATVPIFEQRTSACS